MSEEEMVEKSGMAAAFDKIIPESYRMMAKQRLDICNSCDKLKNRKCLMCGCFMDLKVYIPDAMCPIRKW